MKHTALSFLLFATACTSDSSELPEVKSDLARDMMPDVTDAELAELVAGNTAFAADLYRQVRTEDGNLFMSPHSISTALAMTYAGANGATATQMAEALHFTLPTERLHPAQDALDLALASRAASSTAGTIPFRLRNANSIWGQQGFDFQTPFLDTLAVNYGAGLHVLDFARDSEGSRETINGWVEDQTNEKIKNLLPDGSITEDTRLVLTNAIYFSAAWAEPFKVENTADRPFHAATGTLSVPTLHQVHEMGYGRGDGFEAAEIPYDGEKLSMLVVVPTGDLATFEASLTGATLSAITSSLTHHAVDLTLPKFKFDAPISLKSVLRALGMVEAFAPDSADFSGIDGTRRLVISDVLHKGYVAIDEKGTEAAAATAVVITDTSVPQPATLTVDKPFLFLIRDIPTGAILFLGRVVDPR